MADGSRAWWVPHHPYGHLQSQATGQTSFTGPAGAAHRETLQELPGAAGLQHAADGAPAGATGAHDGRRHPPGESGLLQSPAQPHRPPETPDTIAPGQ